MQFPDMSKFLVLLLFIFFYTLFAPHSFSNDNKEQSEKINRIDGYPVVLLDIETQRIAGIETVKAELSGYRPEFTAFGTAINIQPLLELRHKYLLALTDSRSASAKFAHSEQSVQRIEDLYRNGIAAKRSLQEQQSQWRIDRSQADAARFQSRAIVSEGRLLWGKQLTDWAIAADADKLDAFVTGKKTLLQITLPAGKNLPDNIKTIYVEVSGDRGKAQEARLISIAPQADNTAQGAGYFFETEGQGVPIGMHVSAWIPEQKDPVLGVIIPKSAVIRSMSQTFVYIKKGGDQFSRRMLPQAKQTKGGYFVGESIKAGEEIVTLGGQMLLSEELRGQIPDEDD